MKEKLIRFFQSRYGMDNLSNCLVWTGIGLMILNLFFRNPVINIIALILIFTTYFRAFSKNYNRCSAQNQWYLDHTKGIRSFFKRLQLRWKMRKTHHIYRCKKCGQDIRIPKGKGKIMITCPKCHNEFMKRS